MKPIPKDLLIHNGTIAAVTKDDGWGPVVISPAIPLSFIRIEPSRKIVRDKQNNEVQTSSLMFYDCVNSRPLNQVFDENTVITRNSKDYKVILIDELYDGKRLHHLEIGLA